MKKLFTLALLLMAAAGMQTADAQGFRVYQSDGTQFNFSLKTDSIVFDNGLSGDEVFGPFTPVNECIVGTWHWGGSTVTFNADGTTDFNEGSTYEFMPYQGIIIIYNASGKPSTALFVYKLTSEEMYTNTTNMSKVNVWTRVHQDLPVTDITLSATALTLKLGATKQLTATVLPEDATNKVVTWQSLDELVATVDDSGLVTGVGNGTTKILCRANDGSGIFAECQVRVKEADTMEYVDLGLPSGTLWATCNVGASSPEEYGDYFAWGETEPKDTYDWSTYKYCNGSVSTQTKYCNNSSIGYNGFTDTLTELEPEDDAATANWGAGWQTPSYDQITELHYNTTTTWTTQNGINGRLCTASNGNSIFLPAAGCRYGTSPYDEGSAGYYRSRSLDTSDSNGTTYCLYFSSDYIYQSSFFRQKGFSVRPVRKQ